MGKVAVKGLRSYGKSSEGKGLRYYGKRVGKRVKIVWEK